jgi:hypothetical protein
MTPPLEQKKPEVLLLGYSNKISLTCHICEVKEQFCFSVVLRVGKRTGNLAEVYTMYSKNTLTK